MEDAPLILREPHGSSATLTFNRPDKLNALSSQMLRDLDGALADAEADPDVRVVILTGSGPKAFVAGADIGEYADIDMASFLAYQSFSRRLFSRIDAFPKPVIAAVNGYALGGGFEIALCCDVLLASEDARFGLPEGLLGLCPGGGGTQRLTRAVGPFVAADVLLSARRLSAREAAGLGLVAEVTTAGDLLDRARAKAEEMARIAPRSATAMLALVEGALELPLEEGLTAEQTALAELRRTADAQEGISAFVEKRPPRFRGE